MPNIFFWEGPKELYPLLVKKCYAAIKEEDPEAQVLAISTSGIERKFIARVLEAGAPFDVLGIHPVETPDGTRRLVPMAEFHRLPGDEPWRDNNLDERELITAVELPAQGYANHSAYLKLRDRASYAFALVSVAAALDLDGEQIRGARIALGGVAHKPWRVIEAEQLLCGRRAEPAAFAEAAERLLQGAQPLAGNAFKIELARRAIVRALGEAAGGTPR